MSNKIFIDFTVFATPLKPHARVSGYVEVAELPIVGGRVSVVDKQGHEIVCLAVEFVSDLKIAKDHVYGLDDVVFNSPPEAKMFCQTLDEKTDLECEELFVSR